MNIGVFESFADIFPSLSPIEAAHYPAVLDAEIDGLGIFRIDVDVANVALMRRMWEVDSRNLRRSKSSIVLACTVSIELNTSSMT